MASKFSRNCDTYGITPLLLNPGSATQRRRQPHRTIGILHLHAGAVRAEIVPVD